MLELALLLLLLLAPVAQPCTVAVSYSGHLRSFTEQRVRDSHVRHLLAPLRADCAVVDVFAYAALRDVPKPANPAGAQVSEARARLLLAGVNASASAVAFHDDAAEPDRRAEACPDARPPYAPFHQLWKIGQGFEQVRRQEAAQGWRYDWVVRARFDAVWLRPVPGPGWLDPTRAHTPASAWPVSDMFAVVPRALADAYFSLAEGVFDCASEAEYPPGFGDTEIVFWRHMRRRGVPLETHAIPMVLVRPQVGARCHTLEVHSSDLLDECLQTFGNAGGLGLQPPIHTLVGSTATGAHLSFRFDAATDLRPAAEEWLARTGVQLPAADVVAGAETLLALHAFLQQLYAAEGGEWGDPAAPTEPFDILLRNAAGRELRVPIQVTPFQRLHVELVERALRGELPQFRYYYRWFQWMMSEAFSSWVAGGGGALADGEL